MGKSEGRFTDAPPGVGVGTYNAKAEALIELLEIHDCGSVGGFDPDCGGDALRGLLYLEQRFEALKRKYALTGKNKKKQPEGLLKIVERRRKAKRRGA